MAFLGELGNGVDGSLFADYLAIYIKQAVENIIPKTTTRIKITQPVA